MSRRLGMIGGMAFLAGSIGLGLGLSWAAPRLANPEDEAWREVPIPETWKEPPRIRPAEGSSSGRDGFAWYRCAVEVPADWAGEPLALFVEPVDDARAAFVNGVQVGAAGSFPPRFRSGLGEQGRFPIPDGVIRPGEPNVVAVRVYYNDGRSNFAVAAPALYAEGRAEAIKMEGPWEYRAGDDPSWAAGPVSSVGATYARLDRFDDLDAYLRLRQGDTPPLAPEVALDRFQVSVGLAVDLALADPVIAQPLQVSFDERGRMWVVEYRQYPDPAGLTPVSRDKFLRTVYDTTPEPPPHGPPGIDRVSIHEDRDGDGTFETHSVFLDDLNLATSIARGRGGVFVLNPPYLLFYPDRDQDDVPDGDPEVLLEGFGLEDSHSIANSLTWGPDGWLYAAQGSTVTGRIRRPGDPEEAIVHSMGQLIWRYHPETRRYEVFAEGGGNTFGVEIDAVGRVYSGHNGGDTRGFHYVQGGYYQKGFTKHGSLSNPYAFGYFPPMAHHSVPRFSHSFLLYEGGAFPEPYPGKLFGVEPLQGQVVLSEVMPEGSTFKTADLERPMRTEDPWFRPVAIALGPDGALYISDFYEQRIDHSSHYAGRVDKTNGRVYRLRASDSAPGAFPGAIGPKAPFDLSSWSSERLLGLLEHPNRWFRREALRLLGDRKDPSLIPGLREDLLALRADERALESLWALNLCGGLDEPTAVALLDHPDRHVRSWSVRLMCDDFEVSDAFAAALADLASREPYVSVRSQLASSARRLPAPQALPIVRALLRRDEDAADPHLPLLLWWAIESKVGEEPDRVLALFEEEGIWAEPIVRQAILGRLMQRFARAGSRADLIRCALLLERAPSRDVVDLLLAGFEEAFEGRALSALPERLVTAIAASGGGSLPLRVRQGDAPAVAEAIAIVTDPAADPSSRLELIRTLGEVREPRALPALKAVASTEGPDALRAAALASLRPFDEPEIAQLAISLHDDLPDEARDAAQELLVGRRSYADAFLEAISSGRVDRRLVPETMGRKVVLLGDEDLAAKARELWGELGGASAEQLRREVERFEAMIRSGTGNPYTGKELFLQSCGKCHTLFDDGGDVGPNLTSYQRDDLRSMLTAVVDPAAEVREGYETYLALLLDGRVVTGFLVDRDDRVVVLRGADGRNEVLPRAEIEELTRVPQSVMPAGLLEPLSAQQVRDLFAYLRSTQPLNN
ncbi:PVC-type heme-binding CxxCH protein [Tautonia sociabilis]|uniref:C-type cytochrome n=1 Tax=Tautonia sociabilis TaxID=2080755 RepID=A0A432MH82_9BACT|nr:PVC-type heme-binding CxxCH protein [Tautonia sociabilis]RUL86112.1 c-type cytochrome [Tautonia sociabilis]